MARAYSDTADQQFQTFEDQRNPQPEPAGYYADARPEPAWDTPAPAQDWWQDDAYQRSDIVLESHTDPTGWKAQSLVPMADDRPPAEAGSGNRLLTVLLFFAGLATSVSLWLFETEAGAVADLPTLMMAIGRITGPIGGHLLFIQLLVMGRGSFPAEWVGARDLLKWHRWLGPSLGRAGLGHAGV